MLGVRHSSSPIRLRPKLVRPARGCLLLVLLLPVGLLGQETRQVTLYTPDGSQQRLLSTPLVVDVELPLPPLPMNDPVSSVIGTGTGTRLTEMEVVFHDSAGGQSTISYANGKIGALAADPSGNVWVATSAGLSRFDSGQWTTFTQADGLADDHIHSVVVDGQGQVWAGSLNGLSRFDSQHWTRYRFEERWDREIVIAPNGDMWCTGGQDFLLARFDGQAWWTYDHANMGIIGLARFHWQGWSTYDHANMGIVESEASFDDVHVTNIAVDRSGTLWAVLEFWKHLDSGWTRRWNRLLTFNGTQWTSYQSRLLDFPKRLQMIFPDSQGRVWLDCAALCVTDGSTWKSYYNELGIFWNVFEVTEDAAGRLWIVVGSHFGMLEGTTWTGFSWEEFRVARAPVFDSRSDLWIPSYEGLYRWHRPDLPTAIASSSMSGAPHSFHLAQNYPNPFNHATHIGFTLQQPSAVSLQVFNTHGQLVATLVEGMRPAGTYQTAWDGRDAHGQVVSSGVYIVRLDAEGRQATRKMLLIQ